MKNVINKLKEEKSSKKLTNAELSNLSGVPLGTVNKILSGATKSVKAETLEKLTSAIFNGDEEVYENKPLTYGFLKVGACTPEIVLASPKDNAQKIIESVNKQAAMIRAFRIEERASGKEGDFNVMLSISVSNNGHLDRVVSDIKKIRGVKTVLRNSAENDSK